MSDVTHILLQIESGDSSATEELLPLVYQQLRNLAAAAMAREKPGQTIQPTILVHEAYLRLVQADESRQWNSRKHFFRAAAEAMRRILIENARRKQRQRHGGGRRRCDVNDLATTDRNEKLLALDEALSLFEQRWPDQAMLVKLRYFSGMTIPEAALTIGVSHATAERYWTFARAWLLEHLKSDD